LAFTPSSSIPGGGAGGNVFVTNFPADQTVHFATPQHVDVDSLPSVTLAALPPGAATEATLERAAAALDDVGLTAILQRERMETE
jgi:hypothetical protein